MEHLLDSLFLEIFSYFSICEKLRCSAVCRRWRRLVLDWKLWQEINVHKEPHLCSRLTDEKVKRWASAWGPRIRELYLGECHWLTDQAVCYIGEQCPNLRVLHLAGCTQVSDVGISELSNSCFELRAVDLHRTRVSDLGFNFLVESNPGLERMRLPSQGNCRRMIDAICRNCCKVTELTLQNAIDEERFILDDETFRRFAERFPMLRKLDLTWCCRVTDRTLQWIARNCVSLRSLRIKECPMISDDGIRFIAERCRFLDDLHLERQSLVKNACCYAIRDHLRHIRTLKLLDTCVTDKGIEAITTNAGNLRKLCIGEYCFRPQNIKGLCLPAIARKCNKLEKLHVYSVKMDDAQLQRLCANLLQLRDLHLGTCRRVSRAGIRELTEKCGKLTQLRLYGCPSFRDCHLQNMALKMPRLRRLEILGCNKVTEDGANQFTEKRPDCLLKV